MTGAPIAICGMSGRLPGARDMAAFHKVLREGTHQVRPLSPERVRLSGAADPAAAPLPLAWVEGIDRFDYAFFGLSPREAEAMDPHQRMALELTVEAIEDAGHAPGSLAGSVTGVWAVAPRPGYSRLRPVSDALSLLGDAPSSMAGRLAWAFDFRGPAVTVDTGCSSGLVALDQAVGALRSGKVDFAVVCAVSLHSVVDAQSAVSGFEGIVSPSARCAAFGEGADGAVPGEGGLVLVLRTAELARAECDPVRALVTGTAVNSNGRRSSGLSAPSPEAQAEVLSAAWDDAGVSPHDLTMLEAHGSGTRLGDLCEVEGLRLAVERAGGKGPRPKLALGSVKSVVGHLDGAAGLAGVAKAVLALESKSVLPTLHAVPANPSAPLDAAGAWLPTAVTPWAVPEGQVRRAGVSSFALAGTNAHAVLEEAPVVAAEPESPGRTWVAALSARTPSALSEACRRLARVLGEDAGGELDLRDVCGTLTVGRDHHPWRRAWAVGSVAALRESLLETPAGRRAGCAQRPVAFVFPGEVDQLDDHLRRYAVARRLGIREIAVAGAGVGRLAARVARGELDRDQASVLSRSEEFDPEPDESALTEFASRLAADNAVVLCLGPDDGTIARFLVGFGVPVYPLATNDGEQMEMVAHLYEAGVDVDWERHWEEEPFRRTRLPGYPFEGESCWPRQTEGSPAGGATTDSAPSASAPARRVPDGQTIDIAAGVAAAWEEALGLAPQSPDDDWFSLGGSSILGAVLIDAIERDFGVRITFESLYENPTLAGLIAVVGSAIGPPSHHEAIPARGAQTPRMSFGQERLWFLDQLDAAGAAYNLPVRMDLTGPLDVDALRAALTDVVSRHEVLRSRFIESDGAPAVVIDSEPRLEWNEIDLSDLDADAVNRAIETEAARPFELATGPLVRALLARTAPQEASLCLTLHHIVDDGWSGGILNRELSAAYAARRAGRAPSFDPLPVQFYDWAAWQRQSCTSEALAEDLAWWQRELSGVAPLDLPTDRLRPPRRSEAGEQLRFSLSSDITRAVRELARSERVTPFVVMLAAVNAWISRLASTDDVTIGTVTTGRDRSETRGLIGFFNNTLALRTDLSGSPSFRELVDRTRGTVTGALDHARVPFESVVEAVAPRRDLGRHPIFDVVYTHQNAPWEEAELEGLRVRSGVDGPIGLAPGTSKYDLTLSVADQPGEAQMSGVLEHRVDLFSPATAARFVDSFRALLAGVLRDVDVPVHSIALTSETEAAALVEAGRGGPPIVEPACFPSMVAAIAAKRPEAVALEDFDGGRYTFHQLSRWAGSIATAALAQGVRRGDVVALEADRSAATVAAWLGIMAAGAAVLPLGQDWPATRRAAALATADHLLDPLPPFASDEPGWDECACAAGDLAYVITTSGSTGEPKAVELTHVGLANLATEQAARFGIGPGSRVLQVAPPSVDAAVAELVVTLSAGATLVLGGCDVAAGDDLASALVAARISHVTVTPTVLATLPEGAGAPNLRTLIVAGEVCAPELASRWASRLQMFNAYGPTEVTVCASAARIDPDGDFDRPLSIGRPLRGFDFSVRDEGGNPVPDGLPGELWIGGIGLARGYRSEPLLTSAAFVSLLGGPRLYRTGDRARRRADGEFELRGRLDDQVKVRGHRVELGEVEAALASFPGVSGAAAALRDGELVGYVVRKAAAETLAESEYLDHLRGRLPAPCVPGVIVELADLPRGRGGKLDRGALPPPPARRPGTTDGIAPKGPTEELVARIWEEVLGMERVGADLDFFDMGGHSLKAVQVMSRLNDALALELPIATLFDASTVQELAKCFAAAWDGPERCDEVASIALELRAMSDEEIAGAAAEVR